MNRSSLKTLILACLLIPNAAWATEKLSDEKLVIQAEILRNGDFMGFGFGSLWMMSGSNLIRVDPSNNSVTKIDIHKRFFPISTRSSGPHAAQKDPKSKKNLRHQKSQNSVEK